MADEVKILEAILDKQPPGMRARVKADVFVPTIGSSATLVKRNPQGFNPKILMLDVRVDQGSGQSGQATGRRVQGKPSSV